MSQALEGWGPNRALLDAIEGPQRRFYADWLAGALDGPEPLDHEYECPTPELARRFLLRAYPLHGQGLLMVHSPIGEAPHEAALAPVTDLGPYTDAHGIVHVCGHCRRSRRVSGEPRYDWVPAVLDSDHPALSHGLCPACALYHFPFRPTRQSR